jgi:TRAP-type C4-dicarboxylate transport system permease small subunit
MAHTAERVRRLVRAIDRMARIAVGCLIGVMVVAVFAQVVFRYAVVRPIFWADELSRYLFVWIAFLGAGVAMGQRAHYGFDYFTGKCRPAVRRAIGLVVTLVGGGFLAVCLVLGITGTGINLTQRSPSLQISMAWVYAALPTGAALLLLHLLDQALNPSEAGPSVAGPE